MDSATVTEPIYCGFFTPFLRLNNIERIFSQAYARKRIAFTFYPTIRRFAGCTRNGTRKGPTTAAGSVLYHDFCFKFRSLAWDTSHHVDLSDPLRFIAKSFNPAMAHDSRYRSYHYNMNPYKTIWLYPKRTFSAFVARNEQQSFFAWPIIIMGLSHGLDMAPEISALFDERFVWWSLLITIPIGIGTDLLILGLIMPGLVKLVGRIWNGASTMRQMVNVYSISSIPLGLALIYQLMIFAFGQDPLLEQVNSGLTYLLWLWSFGLLILGVSKTQRFNYGMALLNILLSYLPILIIGLLWSSYR